jgi:predicted DNA-binding transcriptional regulator AlpA
VSKKPKPKAKQVTAARAKAAALLGVPSTVRLFGKHEVCAIAAVSFPTLWAMMRRGQFPRSRIVGGKSMWISTEIEQWLARLPVRPLKGDAPGAAA